jgi:aryl-alcohol dehydrogenase-like predicted oxidoreductase
MEYRLLGLSGCAVSALALGTLTFGNETSDPGAPDYPYGERGQTQRDRRISGGRF